MSKERIIMVPVLVRERERRDSHLWLLCLASYPITTPLFSHSSEPNSSRRQLARPCKHTHTQRECSNYRNLLYTLKFNRAGKHN